MHKIPHMQGKQSLLRHSKVPFIQSEELRLQIQSITQKVTSITIAIFNNLALGLVQTCVLVHVPTVCSVYDNEENMSASAIVWLLCFRLISANALFSIHLYVL